MTLSFLIHIAGVIAVSQLILSSSYQREFFHQLDSNTTLLLHGALDSLADVTAFLFPGRVVGVGTVLQSLVYLAVTLYALYLARLVFLSDSLPSKPVWHDPFIDPFHCTHNIDAQYGRLEEPNFKWSGWM